MDALTQVEDAVDGLYHLERRNQSPVSEKDDTPPRVVTEQEHNTLVNALAMVKTHLASTQPNTDERRQVIMDAYHVIEPALYSDEEDDD